MSKTQLDALTAKVRAAQETRNAANRRNAAALMRGMANAPVRSAK